MRASEFIFFPSMNVIIREANNVIKLKIIACLSHPNTTSYKGVDLTKCILLVLIELIKVKIVRKKPSKVLQTVIAFLANSIIIILLEMKADLLAIKMPVSNKLSTIG